MATAHAVDALGDQCFGRVVSREGRLYAVARPDDKPEAPA